MTEQPDTAEFRRLLVADELLAVDVLDLIQALDAARAQLRTVNGCLAAQDENEARQRARAEMATARIAAALAVLRDAYDRGDFEAIIHALTGGTE